MEQHRTITIEGRTVHYRDEGRENTRTLVLLHGFLQNLDVWSSYVLSYMTRFRVITIDLPGHGLTESFCDVHTMDFMAKTVKSVLNEAGVDQCVMVGHSMGGYVALAFAETQRIRHRGFQRPVYDGLQTLAEASLLQLYPQAQQVHHYHFAGNRALLRQGMY